MNDGEAAFRGARDVSRETLERLRIYEGLLRKWTPRINLVSRESLAEFWTRHVLDSTQLLDLAPLDARTWCDLGTGGGFPGLVLAILALAERPGLQVTLIEADQRKSTFLRTVVRETGAGARILGTRIESAPQQHADVVSARALAPLPRLLDLAKPHLAPEGVALFPKGARHAEELATALDLWRFRCETVPSQTDAEAVILRISELSRA